MATMRGLTLFISDLRNAGNREKEQMRIDKEMAKIRKAFKDSRSLSPYQKKKYVWKMLYMFILGYEIDFGHMEALSLISGTTWSEKQVGYLACALLLNENHEFLRLVINSVKNDLVSQNEDIQCLALACVANVGGKEFSEALISDVEKLLHSTTARTYVKKKACLCLIRLYRKYPDFCNPENIRDRVLVLLDDRNLGVVTSTMSLLLGLVAMNPEGWEVAVPKVCKLVSKLAHPNAAREVGQEYVYHHTVCPWLQVKLLRFLQYFNPPEDPEVLRKLVEVLSRICTDTHTQKDVNRNNAQHAILLECINLAIHIETDSDLLSQAMTVLGRHILNREANYRYLVLDTMQRMSGLPDMAEQFKRHQSTIIGALKDKDVSLRRRALDLLYGMCDTTNSQEIVQELLNYLTGTDFTIREELVLRVAILAEKFASELSWYVDVILQLISLAGDNVSDEIWFRVIQIVTNNEDTQKYAAETVFKALQKEPVHETMVKVGSYILGEFGHHIDEEPDSTPLHQFNTLNNRFATVSQTTKGLMLTAFIKFENLYPDLRPQISAVFETYNTTIDTELQQRAVEYISLGTMNADTIAAVLDMMPAFPDGKQSLLIKRLGQQHAKRAVRDKDENEAPEQETKMVELDAKAATGKSAPRTTASGGGGGGAKTGDLFSMDDEPVSISTRPAPAAPSSGLGDLDDLLGGPSIPVAHAPAPVAAPKSGLGDLDDLLGGFSSAPAPAPSAGGGLGSLMDDLGGLSLGGGGGLGGGLGGLGGVSLGGGGGGLLDLMGGGGGFGEPQGEPEIATPEQVKELFKEFTLRNEGLLYQDGFITIQVNSEFQMSRGMVNLTFNNKLSQPLDNFRTLMQPVPYLRNQLSQMGTQLGARGSLHQNVEFEVLEPFLESPAFKVTFTYGGKMITISIKLPIHICKFMQGVQCDAQQYFSTWKNYANPPLEFTSVFKSARPVNVPEVNTLLSNGLHFAVLAGVDPSPTNVVAAGKVACGQAVLYALVRIESNQPQQAYRLTIRTSNGQATAAIKNAIMQHLAAPS